MAFIHAGVILPTRHGEYDPREQVLRDDFQHSLESGPPKTALPVILPEKSPNVSRESGVQHEEGMQIYRDKRSG